jgi:dihydroxyacetone kinase
MFELESDKVELGLGIHGEPGQQRMILPSARKLCDTMLDKLIFNKRLKLTTGLSCGDLSLSYYHEIISGDKMCVLINNLGKKNNHFAFDFWLFFRFTKPD